MRFRATFTCMVVLIYGCGNTPPPDAHTNAGDSAADSPDSLAGEAELEPPESVLLRYYRAIDAGNYRQAYSLWGDSGRASGQKFEQFRDGFRNTASVEVRIGVRGRIEGAAGSRYVEVPVEVEAVTSTGGVQRFTGTYTLRRAVVEGANDEQMRWHIYAADVASCPDRCEMGGADSAHVAQVVRAFGERLRMSICSARVTS